MSKQLLNRAEATPITLEEPGRPRGLVKVVVESDHPSGHGRVNLTVDQALYIHSRLTQIAAQYVHPDRSGTMREVPPEQANRSDDPFVRLGKYGAEAWPLGDGGTGDRQMDLVLIESIHPDGHGVVRLSPAQSIEVRDQLERISLDYLHENVWGGEDARVQ